MTQLQKTQGRSALAVAAAALALLFAAAATQPAAAQPADAASLCTPDVMRLCNEFIPDRDRIVVCLKAKRSQLSPGCRGVMSPTRSTVTADHAASPKAKRKRKNRRHSRPHAQRR